MAEKGYSYNHTLNVNNEDNLLPLRDLEPPLIVISGSAEADEAANRCGGDLLSFGQDEMVQKEEEEEDLKCLQCSARSPWRNNEEDGGETRLKDPFYEHGTPDGGKRLKDPFYERGTPNPSRNSFKTEGKCKTGPEVSWEEYKSLLLRVWEEKSLKDLFAKRESLSVTSHASNACGEIPYIIDLLTNERGLQTSHDEPEQKDASAFPGIPAALNDDNKASHTQLLKQQQQQQQRQKQEPKSSAAINSRLMSPAVEKTPQQPLPLFNVTKETSKAQGEASGRPTLFLRSNASLQPQEGGGGGEDSPSRRPNPLSKMPFHFFTNQERHDQAQRTTTTITSNHNHLPTNYTLLPTPREREESLPKHSSSPPQSFPPNTEPPPPYFGRMSNCGASEMCVHDGEIQNLKLELEKAQSRIANLSYKMNDQSSHLKQLIEERNVLQEKFTEFVQSTPTMSYPLFTQQGYKTPHPAMYPPGIEAFSCAPHPSLGRRASWQYPYEIPRGRISHSHSHYKSRPEELVSQLAGSDPRALEDLRDRIVALQMQNIELNLFLKKEEVRRKEAEEAVKKEKEYVRKLQESIQDISTSTLIIDPLTYKQVADNYIASKKKPVRRTHTCNPYIGSSDLVCDSNRLKVVQNKNQSTSCPSSPLGSAHERKSSNLNSRVPPSTPTGSGSPFSSSPSSDCIIFSLDKASPSEVQDANHNWNLDGEGCHQYQELLTNLDNLQVSSSPS